MPRHLIVTCMNLSMASMLDKNSFFGLGDPRIGVVVVGSSNSLCIPQLAFNTCDLEPWSSSIASCVGCCRLRRIGHSMDLGWSNSISHASAYDDPCRLAISQARLLSTRHVCSADANLLRTHRSEFGIRQCLLPKKSDCKICYFQSLAIAWHYCVGLLRAPC